MNEKPKAIVCDIDGCLLDVSHLYKSIYTQGLKGEDKWTYFHDYSVAPQMVIKIPQMFNMVNAFSKAGYKIILLTSRRELIAHKTLKFLLYDKTGEVTLDYITMMVYRPKEMNGVPSHIYKKQEILKLQKYYDIQLVIDDELENCKMFEDLGYTVLKVMRRHSADD